ncbi:MAG: Hpt domain-containing protein, partial [Bryobacteraceae bacterium]
MPSQSDQLPAVSDKPVSAPATNPLANDPELLGDFILESREHLTSIELQLLTLDQDPGNAEAIHAVFRGFHTIKGMAGFLDLDAVRDVAHEVETILDLARNSQLAITSLVIDRVLESKDYLSRWMAALEAMLQSGKTPSVADPAALVSAIRELANPAGTATQVTVSLPSATAPVATTSELGGKFLLAPEEPAPAETPTNGLLDLARELASAPPDLAPEPSAAPVASENPEASRATEGRAANARSIKVDTAKLDYLVDMVGEMVIAQSLVNHDPDLHAAEKPRLARNLSQLARITDEVQRTAMSMRMIPVGQLFQKTARLVRDLSRKASKQVDLELSGEDTELDRNIVEELADP